MKRNLHRVGVGLGLSLVFLVGSSAQQSGGSGGQVSQPKSVTRVPPAPTGPQQVAYYTGKVVLDLGIAPPSPAAILRDCDGVTHRETYTSADGSFSFMVGDRATTMLADASEESHGYVPYTVAPRNNSAVPSQRNFDSPMSDCVLRADLAGFTSSSIHLNQSMTNSDVGVIVLHSRARKAEGMVSVTSLEAPGKARREFEKGSEQLEKGDLAAAEKSLRKAIEEYPKFAEAWTCLGDLEQRRRNTEAAVKDYQAAIKADPNFPLSYLRMAFLTAVARDWDQTRKLTEKLISLDPVDFPMAYYYNAVAEFNLRHIDKAESPALQAERLDKLHYEPRVELLLASIYYAKGTYPSAAEHYRAYLKLVPDGPFTDRVKTNLAKTEELARSQTPVVPANDK